jgi:hypothetical protein
VILFAARQLSKHAATLPAAGSDTTVETEPEEYEAKKRDLT